MSQLRYLKLAFGCTVPDSWEGVMCQNSACSASGLRGMFGDAGAQGPGLR